MLSTLRNPGPASRVVRHVFTLLILGLLTQATGCSRKRYEQAADRQTYQIIHQAEQQVFGRTNLFSIDTDYTGRDPATLLPEEIIGQRTGTEHRVLNLEEALDLAVGHSREYQTQKEQLYLTALSLTGAQYEFSPIFLANSTASVSGSPSASQFGTLRSRVGVGQLLQTGGRLSVSLANDLLRYFTGWSSSPGNTTRDSAIDFLSVELSQPLLRGFGRNDPRVENLTQAERNVVYAVRSFSQYQRQFAVDTVSAYFGLLALKDTVRNNFTNYLRRVETTKYVDARAVDRVRRSEVDDARSAELSARIDYINSVATYLNSSASFKLRLGIPQSDDLFLEDKDLRDLAEAGLITVDLDRNAGFRIALENQLELLNAIDRFEDSKRKVRLAADALKPGLLLSSSASLQNDALVDYARIDLNEVRYSVSLGLDLPVDRRRERNTYRATLVSFEAQIRALSLSLDNAKNRIDEGLRTLEQRRLNYLNRQASLEVANRRVENNTLLLEAGRATLRDVREAQDLLIAAQNAETITLVDFLRVRLQLLVDVGVLKPGEAEFWLKDPLAERLTPEMRSPSPLKMPEEGIIPPNHFLEPTP